MNIIIDSNVLFSALIKNSFTRRIILEYQGLFLFPSIIFEETERHKEELLKKSGMSPEVICWCGFEHKNQYQKPYICTPFSWKGHHAALRKCGFDPTSDKAEIGVTLRNG